jgi:hypothetical protein
VSLKEDDPIWGDNMTLRITGSGQVLHVFVNGEFIGNNQIILIIYKGLFNILYIN